MCELIIASQSTLHPAHFIFFSDGDTRLISSIHNTQHVCFPNNRIKLTASSLGEVDVSHSEDISIAQYVIS